MIFAILEIFGGIWTNSMAIVSDAIHDLGDSLALGLAYFFEKQFSTNILPKITTNLMNPIEAFNLHGKVALITGASKGIGERMARYFAAYGAKVIVSSRKQEDLDALAAEIKADGGECTGIAANNNDLSQLKTSKGH